MSKPDKDFAEEKRALRTRMRAARRSMDAFSREAASAKAQAGLMDSAVWRSARSVALYWACQGETDTMLLFASALETGKAVWFPRVLPGNEGRMVFVRTHSPTDFVPGRYGIPEPAASLPGVQAQDFACDLAVIPGLAFSRQGARLGQGGGFYDRYFAQAQARARVGFCYAFQLVPGLPAGPLDLPVTHLCTEEGLVSL